MSEELPPNLRRMLDDLPVGRAPLGDLLTERRAQRQRRRWAVAGTAAATVAIIAGGFVVTQVGGDGGTTGDDPVAQPTQTEPTQSEPTVSGPPRPTNPEGTSIELPTSDWRPGDAGMEALIHGTLSTDRRGCVVLRGGEFTVQVVWPADYSAVIDGNGRLFVVDADGKAVARDGDEVSMGGGYSPAGDNQHPCVRDKKEVAWVQDTVTLDKPGADHPLPDLSEPSGAPDDRAFQQWLDREALPDCGIQWFPYLNGFDISRLDYATCLRQGVEEGTGGEAIIHMITVEGDLVTEYLRALPNGSVELFIDSTRDKFGSGRWGRSTCGDLEKVLRHRC